MPREFASTTHSLYETRVSHGAADNQASSVFSREFSESTLAPRHCVPAIRETRRSCSTSQTSWSAALHPEKERRLRRSALCLRKRGPGVPAPDSNRISARVRRRAPNREQLPQNRLAGFQRCRDDRRRQEDRRETESLCCNILARERSYLHRDGGRQVLRNCPRPDFPTPALQEGVFAFVLGMPQRRSGAIPDRE